MVVDPEAEREGPRPPVRRRVEDEVVCPKLWQDRTDDGLGSADVLVWVEVRRQGGVADEAVLVVPSHETRRDANATSALDHHNTEVRDPLPQREAKDLLRSPEAERDAKRVAAFGIAIRGDTRAASGGVSVVDPGPVQRPVRVESQPRHLDVEPEGDPADVAAAGQDHEAGAVSGS